MGKKTTQEILAELRAKDAAKKSPQPTGETPPPEEASLPTEAPGPVETAAEAPAAKPAAPKGGGPKNTKDILAALRAETKSGGKVPAAAVTANKEAKEAAKPTAKTAPAGERPSVQEMVKVARSGAPKEPAAVPTTKAVRKPAALAAAKKGKEAEPLPTRRNVLVRIATAPFALAWTAFSVASVAFLLGCARFMMPNVLVEPPSKFKIGPAADFPSDTVETKYLAEFGVWVVNTVYEGQRMIFALRAVCTHLGCTPNWLDSEQKFKCPCHGSGFYINGVNFEGPAPRPLERVGISQGADGLLEVDKSVKFQQEMGQWSDATSFVPVA